MKVINLILVLWHKYRLSKIKFNFKNKNVIISRNFKITNFANLILQEDIYIGENAVINSYGKVFINNGVIIGPNITIYTANHNFKEDLQSIPYDSKLDVRNVTIEENVWIGGNVIIIPGVPIGEGSIVGAGSVVVKNIEPFSIVGGNPAKKIGERDIEKYRTLKKDNKIYLKLKLNAK